MFNRIRYYIVNVLFGALTRELRYRKRLKELQKRDPFIYK